MDNVVESIFGLSPAQIQQRQNVGMMTAANNYASQDPLQRAAASMFAGGGMLAGAGAQAAGMMTPEMQQAQRTQAIMASGGDLQTSAGLKAKAKQFADAGDQQTAMRLLMLAQDREAKEAKSDPFGQIAPKDYTPESIAVYMRTKSPADLRIPTTVAPKDKPTTNIEEYEYAKKNNGYKGTLEQWMQRKSQTSGSGGSESKQPLVYIDPVTGKAVWGNIGEAKGKPAAAYDPITKQLVSQGIELGKGRGDEIVNLPKMESALTSIKGAEGLLDKGIYTGFWGPAQKNAISATPGADKDKVSNTDQFVAYIGEVVVPRLKEFGGNDSNEELKYLQKISGGDISMQEPALRAILKNAEIKIQRGVDRVKKGMTPSGAPGANQGGIEKWERDASGKLVRVSR
jgi:hypothetical protein